MRKAGSVVQIWNDANNPRPGFFRAYWCDSPTATTGSPVFGLASAGGSHKTIRAVVLEVRRYYPAERCYRNGREVYGDGSAQPKPFRGPQTPRLLSDEAIGLARAIRAVRPPVIAGTNAIPDDRQRTLFYSLCTAAGNLLWPDYQEQDGTASKAFFDACGVAD